MGCATSQPIVEDFAEVCNADEPTLFIHSEYSEKLPRRLKQTSPADASKVASKIAHDRLRKLLELDAATKVPFILVELRGEAQGRGFIEVCGKDEYGVYAALDEWLTTKWGCKQIEAGDLSDDTPLPFSERTYSWGGFVLGDEEEGTSSMGKNTMELIDFMCEKLSWTLGIINGGNLGARGEIREQQIIFKAPHPMNLTSPHIMVELRSAGYIELCGVEQSGIADELEEYIIDTFNAERVDGHEHFCDRYYKCGAGIFQEYGKNGDNNLGSLTVQMCDFVGKGKPWSLVTMNGGNYGQAGTHREQQLVFRLDASPLGEQPHLLVELRDAGYIEISGEDVGGVYGLLADFLKSKWRCGEVSRKVEEKLGFCQKKYKWKPRDMMKATAELTTFFHEQGWQMQICSQGTVNTKGKEDSREQQIIFRPSASGKGVIEPHLVLDLFMGEGDPQFWDKPNVTQVLTNQRIRLCAVGADTNSARGKICAEAVEKFRQFMAEYLGGKQVSQDTYSCDVFMTRGLVENNLGFWTMRICDFMVDRLGWSFVVCNICNLGKLGQNREQQLIFRWDGERRDIPVTKESELFANPERYTNFRAPDYWVSPEVKAGKQLSALITCDQAEVEALQEIVDKTFKRVLTRDRVYEYQPETNEEMPYRLEIRQAFRSENVPLLSRFRKHRKGYSGGAHIAAKTQEGGELVNRRLQDGEALLFHGTNPSSSINILKGGFVLDHAGKSTGTMFGYGVYLAESSSKSDEYARDDAGGSYAGLRAMLVCRSLVGKPLVVEDAGNYVQEAREGGCNCIVGDREKKVGTYREFVFLDEEAIIPEYSIIYQRVYDHNKVPARLQRLKTMRVSGSTGRNWQVRLDKGWASIPSDANIQLIQAMKEGQTIIDIQIGTFMYTFDLNKKIQRNMVTGNERQIRAPRFSS